MAKVLLVHHSEVALERDAAATLAASMREIGHQLACTWEQRGVAGGQVAAVEAAVAQVDRVLLVDPLGWWTRGPGIGEWGRSLRRIVDYAAWAGIDRLAVVLPGHFPRGELEGALVRLPSFELPALWGGLVEWLAQPVDAEWQLPMNEHHLERPLGIGVNDAKLAALEEAVVAARGRGGFIWIRGAAGAGKSTLLTDWFERRPAGGNEPIFHVARPGIAWSSDPERVLAKFIRALLGADFVGSPADALARLAAEACEPAIVVIDGLEQLVGALTPDRLDQLRRVFAAGLPRCVTVIATSRPLAPGVLELEPTIDLDAHPWRMRDAAQVEAAQVELELPDELSASLERGWTGMLARAGEDRFALRSGLSILAAAPEPLPVSLFVAALKPNEQEAVRSLASEWLHEESGRVGFVHPFVRCFLGPELDPLDQMPHVRLLDALVSLRTKAALDEAASAYQDQHARTHRLACHGFQAGLGWVTDVELLVSLAEQGLLVRRLEAALELTNASQYTLIEHALAVARRRHAEFIEQPAALPSQLWAELVGHGMPASGVLDLLRWGTLLPPIRLVNAMASPDRSELRLGHEGDVRGCAIDAAAERAISVTSNRRLHIWSVRSGEQLANLDIGAWAEGCAISADGTRAVVGAGQRVSLWDLDRQTALAHHDDHGADVLTVSMSADGCTVLSADHDGIVRLWQIDRDRRTQLGRHGAVVRCGAISADGRLGITGDDDRGAMVWDLERGERIQTLSGHTYPVGGVALGASGEIAISVCIGEARVWEPRSGQLLHTYDDLGESTHGCVLVDRGGVGGVEALVAESGQELHRWTVADGKLQVRHFAHAQDMRCVAATPDGKWYMTGGQDQVARVWQSAKLTGVSEYSHLRGITSLHASADNSSVWISGGGEGTRRVSIGDGRELERIKPSGVHALAEAGDRVVTGGSNRSIEVHARPSGAEIAKWEPTKDWLRTCAVDPTGTRIAYAGDEGLVFCSDFEGKAIVRLSGHGNWIRALAWTPDGRLVSADNDGELRVWGVDTKTCVRKCSPTNGAAIHALALDGARAFVAGTASSIVSVDLGNGETLVSFEGHDSSVTDLALVEPGMLISVGRDATLRIWSVDDTDARMLARYDAAYPFTRVAVVANRLVAGDAVGNCLILDVDWDRLRGM